MRVSKTKALSMGQDYLMDANELEQLGHALIKAANAEHSEHIIHYQNHEAICVPIDADASGVEYDERMDYWVVGAA